MPHRNVVVRGLLFWSLACACAAAQRPVGSFGSSGTAREQSPVRDASAAKAGTSGVRGRVTASDGAPLARAMVRISSADLVESRTTFTDASGRYEFQNLAAARYSLFASKTGFIGESYGQTRPSDPVKPLAVGANETVARVDFRLRRAGAISGRVLDEFGEPIANASVQAVMMRQIDGARRPVATGARFSTPDTGEFRLWDLSPGEYYVLVNARTNNFMEASDNALGYIPTYFPGTVNVAEAQPVRLANAETATGIDIKLAPARTARISGHIIDARGEPVRDGNVSVMPRLPPGMFMGPSSGGAIRPDGTFSVGGLGPGEYVVRANRVATAPGAPPEAMTAIVTITGDDVTGVVLTPVVPVRITGRIILDPASNALEPSTIRVSAMSRDANGFFGTGGRPPMVKEDFTFEASASPGNVRISAYIPGVTGWRVKVVRARGIDVTDHGIDVASGADLEEVEIVLTNRVQIVTGIVTNSKAEIVEDARIVFFSQSPEHWEGPSRFMATARPDQNGRYSVRQLPPGPYFAVALPAGTLPPRTSDAGFYEPLALKATRVTLREGETQAVDLRLVDP
jgi:protocatechuate 3,4-dioxygenase beta subunit